MPGTSASERTSREKDPAAYRERKRRGALVANCRRYHSPDCGCEWRDAPPPEPKPEPPNPLRAELLSKLYSALGNSTELPACPCGAPVALDYRCRGERTGGTSSLAAYRHHGDCAGCEHALRCTRCRVEAWDCACLSMVEST